MGGWGEEGGGSAGVGKSVQCASGTFSSPQGKQCFPGEGVPQWFEEYNYCDQAKEKRQKREAKEVTEIVQTEQQTRLGKGEKAEAVV